MQGTMYEMDFLCLDILGENQPIELSQDAASFSENFLVLTTFLHFTYRITVLRHSICTEELGRLAYRLVAKSISIVASSY